MAAASILHVGDDLCHRIPVMEYAGLFVVRSECSVGAIQHALVQDPKFSAITFHNGVYCPADVVVSTARTLSPAPLVLFEDATVDCDERLFDLVISPCTPPAVWLNSLREAILDAQNLAQSLIKLRRDCRAVHDESLKLRTESQRLRAETERIRRDPFNFNGSWADPTDKS